MTTRLITSVIIVAAILAGGCTEPLFPTQRPAAALTDTVLPPPSTSGGMSLAKAMADRRSVRSFANKPVAMEQVSQLCWAAQGITDQQSGKRTAPSAMAQYAVNLYVVNKEGCYEYLPGPHALRSMSGPEAMGQLRGACWQPSVGSAPLCLIITIDVERMKPRCGKMSEQYSLLEAGHVAQNVLLQATALELASVPVGGFDANAVGKAMKIPAPQRAVYLLPIGVKK